MLMSGEGIWGLWEELGWGEKGFGKIMSKVCEYIDYKSSWSREPQPISSVALLDIIFY